MVFWLGMVASAPKLFIAPLCVYALPRMTKCQFWFGSSALCHQSSSFLCLGPFMFLEPSLKPRHRKRENRVDDVDDWVRRELMHVITSRQERLVKRNKRGAIQYSQFTAYTSRRLRVPLLITNTTCLACVAWLLCCFLCTQSETCLNFPSFTSERTRKLILRCRWTARQRAGNVHLVTGKIPSPSVIVWQARCVKQPENERPQTFLC